MSYKIFRVMQDHVEFSLGPDCATIGEALRLIDQAERKLSNSGIVSFKIYTLTATLPFEAPADASKTSS